ncbi:MAG: hypothetical protein COZ06_10805 [Armatimonadetes bacterium CG_4_10_14_3_um_filter_66_18]|nr:hypothetical protein [Armatimonadota bacterium]PIU94933.1 MAG: hypothetical protein COS65_05155 [Armatimonadetes bacterium CG06_land_8_20_14_3_00_66_21]PIX40262.1 MAG: hypothetical protein COZ57_26430 [Armatimonadetes bacterium CG_4_8_14_3_um_filter_66_20]PIY50179.1 MAG: hypothetical protein COZ06_10805 [Armatimonadetes bacterium CG_4_10_14_3_um_filter_66_18]PIZ30214.1 MAG: hypothetical protein COY42_34390 [Armatimonadetes bacterium CG_4_10_14_0_8_um_filter_66_14]PJB73174.1 MAG: hypothetica
MRCGSARIRYPHILDTGVVRLLLAAGADVNARDGSGHTPLHCAVENGHWDIAGILQSGGGKR